MTIPDKSAGAQTNIAFAYLAEPYQCYHVATIASALAEHAGVNVTEYIRFPDTQFHLDRIRRAMGASLLPALPFRRSFGTHLQRAMGRLGGERRRLLRENAEALNRFDAVVVTEYRAGMLKKAGLTRPLILMMHGAGDALVHDEHLVREFDLVLVAGPKIRDYFIDKGLTTAAACKIIGYPKFELLASPALQTPKNALPFAGTRPFVLYNPHQREPFCSYDAFLEPLIKGFRAHKEQGLVIAPHVKMFQKLRLLPEWALHRKAGGNIIVDTRSPALLDMTYTANARLYVGDTSSQVYEFLRRPRPCVFLNPHKAEWQNDPSFKFWQAGEVVDDPADLMNALERAPARHAYYREAQERLMRETFGEDFAALPEKNDQSAAERGAEAILNYLARSA